MKAKETIEKLRLIFNELVKSAEVPSATPTTPSAVPAEVPEMNAPIKLKTKDGVEIEVSELQIGAIATISGSPAPIGELVLEDGTTLVIGDNGAITEIKNADGSMPPMVEDMSKKKIGMEDIFSAFQNSTNEKFASYESKFADYEQKFASYEAKLNKAYGVIEGLLNLTQTLAETPTGVADASVKTTNNFKKEKSESYDILFN